MKAIIATLILPIIIGNTKHIDCKPKQSQQLSTIKEYPLSYRVIFNKFSKHEGRNYLLEKVSSIRYQAEKFDNCAYLYDDTNQIIARIRNPEAIIINGQKVLPK